MVEKTDNKLFELAKELERQKTTKKDYIVACDQIRTEVDVGTNTIRLSLAGMNPLNPNEGRGDFEITDYCHDQISEKTGIPRQFYRKLMEQHPSLLTTNINELIRDRDRRMVRTLDGKARALLSSKYRPIENYDVLLNSMEEFKRLNDQEDRGIIIDRADLTDTHLYIKAVSENLTGEILARYPGITAKYDNRVIGGIIISNSEVGAGAYSVTPFMHVMVCSNGLIRDKAFRRVHIGKKMDEGIIDWSLRTKEMEDGLLWSKLTDMIVQTFNPDVFATWVDDINQAARDIIEHPTLAVNHVVKNYNEMPKQRSEELLAEFAHWGYSRWGLSQSITHMAQSCRNYNDQIAMEKLGNEILNVPCVKLEEA